MPIKLPPPFTPDLPFYPFRSSHSAIRARLSIARIHNELFNPTSATVAITCTRSFSQAAAYIAILGEEHVTLAVEDGDAYDYLKEEYPHCPIIQASPLEALVGTSYDLFCYAGERPEDRDYLCKKLLPSLSRGALVCAELPLPPPADLAAATWKQYAKAGFSARSLRFEDLISLLGVFLVKDAPRILVVGLNYSRERTQTPDLLCRFVDMENATHRRRDLWTAHDGVSTDDLVAFQACYPGDRENMGVEYAHLLLGATRSKTTAHAILCRVAEEAVPVMSCSKDQLRGASLFFDADPAYLAELPSPKSVAPCAWHAYSERAYPDVREGDLLSDPYLRVFHSSVLQYLSGVGGR